MTMNNAAGQRFQFQMGLRPKPPASACGDPCAPRRSQPQSDGASPRTPGVRLRGPFAPRRSQPQSDGASPRTPGVRLRGPLRPAPLPPRRAVRALRSLHISTAQTPGQPWRNIARSWPARGLPGVDAGVMPALACRVRRAVVESPAMPSWKAVPVRLAGFLHAVRGCRAGAGRARRRARVAGRRLAHPQPLEHRLRLPLESANSHQGPRRALLDAEERGDGPALRPALDGDHRPRRPVPLQGEPGAGRTAS